MALPPEQVFLQLGRLFWPLLCIIILMLPSRGVSVAVEAALALSCSCLGHDEGLFGFLYISYTTLFLFVLIRTLYHHVPPSEIIKNNVGT